VTCAASAASDCEKAIGRDLTWWSAHLYLAAAYAHTGDLSRARESLSVVERMSPGHTVRRLRAYSYASHPEYQRLAEASYDPD
jgi:hypothetical protein